jgi:Ca2+-binding EF-hand superfamily protein
MNKNYDSSGYISHDELQFYLNHWGLKLKEKEFMAIYNAFDVDGDGKISYSDFHKSVGPEIHPGETLYFR